MEKKKQEASRFSKRQVWGCWGLLLSLSIGIFGFLLIYPELCGKMSRTSLSPAAISTAEMLLELSYTVPIFGGEAELNLEIQENYYDDVDTICIFGNGDEVRLRSYINTSTLFIDEAWIFNPASVYYLQIRPFYPNWCALGELQSGIHLIEFHLKDSFWGEPIHIQQWAMEID